MNSRPIFKRTDKDGQKLELYGRDGGYPEIYFDGVWGSITGSQSVKINLFTIGPYEPGEPQRREVAARLVMPITTLLTMREFINNLCATLIDSGVVTVEEVEGDKKPKRPTRKPKSPPKKKKT